MAGTASDQWWWNDWQGEPTLRTCSLAAQGLWMRMLCVMAEAPKKGYFLDSSGRRMSLERFAKIAGAAIDEVTQLVDELGREGVYSKDRHGDVYCRKMVKLELKRRASAKGGKSGGPASHSRGVGIHQQEPVDNPAGEPVDNSPPDTLFDEINDCKRVSSRDFSLATPSTTSEISITRGATRHPRRASHSRPIRKNRDSSSSESPSAAREEKLSHANGTGRDGFPSAFTIKDPQERLARFAAWLAKLTDWPTVAAALDRTNPNHARALAKCQATAAANDKGWPHLWPVDVNARDLLVLQKTTRQHAAREKIRDN